MSLVRKSNNPIGYRRNGSPIWGYSGAAPDDGGDGGNDGGGDDGGGSDSDEDEDDDDGDEGLTAAGRRAIEAERKAAQRAKAAYKPFAQLARDTGLSVEEMRKRLTDAKTGGKDSKDSKDEVDVEEIRRQTRAEVSAKSDARFVRAAVKAEAASVLNDPADAIRFLDLSDYEVDEDGEVDAAQVKRDLKSLIADKPYLAKKKSAADFDGGPRGKAPANGSMSDVIRRAAGVIK